MKRVIVCLLAAAFSFSSIGLATAADKKADKKKVTPEERFNKLDTDGDKKLSLAEFVGKAEGEKKTKAEAVFKKKDKDESGSLSLEEYVGKAKKPKKP